MSTPVLEHYDVDQAAAVLDQLVDIYVRDVYASDPVFSDEARLRHQVAEHMANPSWQLVTATLDGELVGYIYGFALAADSKWWAGLLPGTPEGFTTETGHRTLAISELLVREPWRRRHIATTLHDELLAGRNEQRATLFVRPDNTPAYSAYTKWGWRPAAKIHPPFEGAPIFDVLILPLPPPRRPA